MVIDTIFIAIPFNSLLRDWDDKGSLSPDLLKNSARMKKADR
jgi:hypothetical protein